MWKNLHRQCGREKGNIGIYIYIYIHILEDKAIKNRKEGIKMFYEKNKAKILMNILNMKLKSKQEKEWNGSGKKMCQEWY